MKNTIIILFLFMFLAWVFIPVAYAGKLSVLPLDGGNTIRFGMVNGQEFAEQEVRIRISGFEGTHYEVYQRILDPMTNEKGEIVHPSSFLTQGLDSSNSLGTLYPIVYDRVNDFDQLIYTSNNSGDSDSFRMLYKIDKSLLNQFGSFNGQIVYTVRSLGRFDIDEVVLSTYMEFYEYPLSDSKVLFKKPVKESVYKGRHGYVSSLN